MRPVVIAATFCTLFATVLGCGSASSPEPSAEDAGAATSSNEVVSADPACAAPQGATCPPKAGNCKGIGAPCTKGGGECASHQAMCDVDLDPRGVGVCITILVCTPGSCGNGATCCKSASTQNVPICMANQCLPADCSADAKE